VIRGISRHSLKFAFKNFALRNDVVLSALPRRQARRQSGVLDGLFFFSRKGRQDRKVL
jgi:hypothetical protein